MTTNKACELCRALKVRCRPGIDAMEACQRCTENGRQCNYPERKRTKRKRTDVRVRELEEQIAALDRLVQEGRSLGATPRRTPGEVGLQPDYQANDLTQPRSSTSNAPKPSQQSGGPLPSSHDPVESGLISMQEAHELYQRYVSDLVPQRPMVVFSPTMDAPTLRRTRPTLFLAVLAAAATTLPGDLGRKITEMAHKVYADMITMQGEKSLELVQAVLVTTNWPYAPDSYDQLNFYHFIHVAATMALDIGLADATRLPDGGGQQGQGEHERADRHRALLACYLCCSSVSLSYHRPHMFPFTRYMERCLEDLEKDPNYVSTDAVLSNWVRLHQIVDASAAVLGLRSMSPQTGLDTEAVQISLQNCVKQLEEFRRSLKEDSTNASLLIQYNAVLSLVNEIGLYMEYDPDDFRPPYLIGKLNRAPKPQTHPKLSPAHLSAIMTCVTAAHDGLEVFLSISTNSLQCGPASLYSRMLYLTVVLLKVAVSVVVKSGALYGIVRAETIKAELYLKRLVQKVTETAKKGCRIAEKWLGILERLSTWFENRMEDASWKEEDTIEQDLISPLKLLNLQSNETSQHQRRNTHEGSNQPSLVSQVGREQKDGRSDTGFVNEHAWFEQQISYPEPELSYSLFGLDAMGLAYPMSPSLLLEDMPGESSDVPEKRVA
ncbi:hypothetical protein GQ53DRAFT_734611 [Thozetella sp. PMI_491]|nr:hypothetical protein GQ53DRAFT_734611 [Thozetella sp. PMI_491]